MKKTVALLAVICGCIQVLSGHGIGIVDGAQGLYLTVVSSHVQVDVTNQIAIVTTTQTMRNDLGMATALQYAFPLNPGANPVRLRWFYRGTWKEASVSSNEQGDDIPGSGSGGFIAPALRQYLGEFPLFFTPRDTLGIEELITFELQYVELLPYQFGEVSFMYPGDLTDIQAVALDTLSYAFHLNSERTIVNAEAPGFPTQDTLTAHDAILDYLASGAVPDRPFEVTYALSSTELGLIALSTFIPDTVFSCDPHGQGYLTLILEPESNINTEVIQKNFTLIIDHSGSMAGNKIVQARQAASFIINHLNPGDNFNIIAFNHSVETLFMEHRPYLLQYQNAALEFISNLSAGGSTNISGALTTAIHQFDIADPGYANIILFFTDGQPTAGITSTEGILQAVSDAIDISETSLFLFPFGIGEDASRPLLTLLAQQNKGIPKFIPDQALESELTNFFLTINNPVLLNTTVTFDPDVVQQVIPYPFPNLYKGQQLIISGRYPESPGTLNMHLEGVAFNVPVSYDFQIPLSDTASISASVIPKIWAKQRIDALSLQYYLATTQEEKDGLQSDIDSISICYGVVSTAFTSFEDGSTTEVEETTPGPKISSFATPSPFTDGVIIHLSLDDIDLHNLSGQVELYSITGQLVRRVKATIQEQDRSVLLEIHSLGDLPAGVYFCLIHVGDQTVTVRLVKA